MSRSNSTFGEPWTDAIAIRDGAAYMASLLTPQHDTHVHNFRSFVRAYKTMEGYHLAMAAKARSDAKMMLTPEGREFIAKRNAAHSAWRASRAALPF